MDLAWLWPIRETMRKAARTFATVLANMERYPSYIFGASQPQQLLWIKEQHPEMYAKIQQRVKEGRWECQGAMWVEPDTNVTGGESLIRQVRIFHCFSRVLQRVSQESLRFRRLICDLSIWADPTRQCLLARGVRCRGH